MLSEDRRQPPAYKTMDRGAFLQLQERGEPFALVDVRSPEEYASGHLPGAVSLPGARITQLAPRRFPQRDAVIVVYCDSGGRSRVAAQVLTAMGYRQVYDLGGAMGAAHRQ